MKKDNFIDGFIVFVNHPINKQMTFFETEKQAEDFKEVLPFHKKRYAAIRSHKMEKIDKPSFIKKLFINEKNKI